MKPDRPVKQVAANLDILRFPAPVEEPAGASCLNCSGPLTLSQPDLDSPDRLIAVCDRCKHWFLIDLIPDQGEGIISRLPDVQVIRNLSHEDLEEGISVMGRAPAGESAPPSRSIAGSDAMP